MLEKASWRWALVALVLLAIWLVHRPSGELPLEQAIKTVRGDGSRVLVTFEDPNCGYCKRLHRDLQSIDNVTVYTFLAPVLGKDSERKAHNIWCARDREHTWREWMVNAVTPAEASCESDVIARNLALARQWNVRGVPALFLSNGKRFRGYIPGNRLEAELTAAANAN
ncbi:MAG: DsbC family protein [Rhodocyclaceae bacterium]|nr:DsbC family protein [Rhodocyclaceae bacterium]